MKKTFLSILVVFIIIASLFCLSSCEKNDDKLETKKFSISFIVDGKVYENISTTGNESIIMPNNPFKDGCEFNGWYLDNEIFSKAFSYSSLLTAPVKDNLEVYAKFTKTYTEGLQFENKSGYDLMLSKYTGTDSEVIIPEKYNGQTVTGVAENAFIDCKNVTYISVPNSVTNIQKGAFRGCSSLESISLPFGEKGKPTNVIHLNGMNTRFGYIFGDIAYVGGEETKQFHNVYSETYYIPQSLRSVTITDGDYLRDGAFSNCKHLTNITIPKTITLIEDYVFSGCDNLNAVYYDGTIDQWAEINFYKSSSNPLSYAKHLLLLEKNSNKYKEIKEIDLTTATKITAYAFAGCESITKVTMPNSVINIGDYAFSGCSSLQCNEKDNALYLGNSNNPYLLLLKAKDTNIEDCVIDKNCKFIHCHAFSGCESLKSVIIPNSVTAIGEYAFQSCRSLTNLLIPNGVTSIGEGAFNQCESLTSVNIPNGITEIGHYTFWNCQELTCLTIPSSVTSIGEAFRGCGIEIINYDGTIDSWVEIKFDINDSFFGSNPELFILDIDYNNYEEVKEVNLSTAKKIGHYPFSICKKLTSITIGESVKKIEWCAFAHCSTLTTINYNGTIAQWNAIPKDSGWDSNARSNYIINCIDGNIDK